MDNKNKKPFAAKPEDHTHDSFVGPSHPIFIGKKPQILQDSPEPIILPIYPNAPDVPHNKLKPPKKEFNLPGFDNELDM
jgi:hypothetical protein